MVGLTETAFDAVVCSCDGLMKFVLRIAIALQECQVVMLWNTDVKMLLL